MAQQTPQRGIDLNLLLQITYNIQLLWRLFWDGRVPILLKILPVFSLIYLVLPDISSLPIIGALTLGFIDDALVLYICGWFYTVLAPKHVVGEHQLALDAQYQRLLGVEEKQDEKEDES